MKRIIIILAVVLAAICLFSGGCSDTLMQEKPSIKTWRDLLNPLPEQPVSTESENVESKPDENTNPPGPMVNPYTDERLEVLLYFYDESKNALTAEKTEIIKTEGIARSTMEALLSGPKDQALKAIVPSGTRLLDINLKKEENQCIIDLSTDAQHVADAEQAQYMINGIHKTLRQFQNIKEVEIRINGREIIEYPIFSELKG